jgi:hypothetical protein
MNSQHKSPSKKKAKQRVQHGLPHTTSSLSPHSLQALEAQTKEENLLAKKTMKAYTGYVAAGQRWLEELCSARGTEVPAGCPQSEAVGPDSEAQLGPNFVYAFDPTPYLHSPAALALFLTYKCVEGNRGRSTAEGIHAAFKNYWQSS